MDRRETLKLLAAASLGATLPGCTATDVDQAAEAVATTLPDGTFATYTHQFFSDAEFGTIRILADLVLPADDRSGSASDARVPEFIDFLANDRPEMQTRLRGGIAWLNYRTSRSFGKPFAECTDVERRQVLDAIAWPDQAADEDAAGVAFFNLFRDVTASGFFSSRMGVEDLEYTGNVPIPSWEGCSDDAMRHVGSTYST